MKHVPSGKIGIGKVYVPETGFKIYVNNVEYTDYALNYRFVEKDNQVKEFSIDFIGTTSSDRQNNIKQQKIVRLESQNKLIFKGTIERVDYKTAGDCTVIGYGSGESILKARVADVTASAESTSAVNRPIYDTVQVKTILEEQLSGISVSLHSVDNGTALGYTSSRGDFASKMSFIDGMVRSKGGKWWFTHGTNSPWDPNELHVAYTRGSPNPVKTYNISGDDQNANKVSNEQDWENLWNDVDVLGYGDGVNQLRSNNFHATTIRSYLADNISATDTTLPLEDATSFGNSGSVWVGMEWIQYSGKSGNNLTGCQRATSTTMSGIEAYAHTKGIEVYDSSFTKESPQSGSSIDTYDIKFHAVQNKTVIKQDTLDRIAQEVRDDHDELVTRIELEPSDPYDAAGTVNVGDIVTINDPDAEISGDFEVFGKTIYSEEGNERVLLECSNGKLLLTTEMEEQKRLSEIESKYMQGATNIFVVNETENADATHPIDIFFEIPGDAVAINQVKLAYRNEAPRVWSAVTDSYTGKDDVYTFVSSSGSTNTLNSSSGWVTVTSLSDPGNCEKYILYLSVLTYTDGSTDYYGHYVNYRIYNDTDNEYYPSSDGIKLSCWGDGATDIPGDNSGVIIVPKNLGGKTLSLEMETGSTTNKTFETWITVTAHAQHMHNVDYTVSGVAYSTTDIKVYTTDDASSGSPSWTDRTTDLESKYGTLASGEDESETGLELTSYFSGTGWKGIRLEPNGNSRHKAQVLVKCFVESKKT